MGVNDFLIWKIDLYIKRFKKIVLDFLMKAREE